MFHGFNPEKKTGRDVSDRIFGDDLHSDMQIKILICDISLSLPPSLSLSLSLKLVCTDGEVL
jgi:hypothetical protein